ncbi:Extradiol ring-cleavage dioxygenase, class III enzyme, subunit B [Choanephora cucurbitarum]|nr:Extradiol ring-cleavage dioxygenase, class III enzyme, subunit B [Choanephora cucurbitarum]
MSVATALKRTPVFYVSHGGPNLLENQEKPGQFFEWLGEYIQNELKPKAIVVISAHWQGEGQNNIFVDISSKPKLIYDFYGFPQRYYEQTWNQPGSPEIANRVIELLEKSGIKADGEKHGHDHGVWVPLKRAMNSTNIPIVEVSTFSHEDMPMHVKLGEALAPLRDEQVLIIGSGSATHNLRDLKVYINQPSPKYVIDFDRRLEEVAVRFQGKDRHDAANKLDQHPDFRRSHPTAEHLVPFHVAVGAAGNDEGKKLVSFYQSSLSWASYGFGLPGDITLPKFKASA